MRKYSVSCKDNNEGKNKQDTLKALDVLFEQLNLHSSSTLLQADEPGFEEFRKLVKRQINHFNRNSARTWVGKHLDMDEERGDYRKWRPHTDKWLETTWHGDMSVPKNP